MLEQLKECYAEHGTEKQAVRGTDQKQTLSRKANAVKKAIVAQNVLQRTMLAKELCWQACKGELGGLTVSSLFHKAAPPAYTNY